MPTQHKRFRYEGFTRPTTTPVPDDLFDVLAPELTEAELRVLLYIVRRTFGFKKSSDPISLTQMVAGLKTKHGKVLDKGTGLSRRGAMNGSAGLLEKGIIAVEKRKSEQGDSDINIYSLRFRQEQNRETVEGVGNEMPYGRERRSLRVGNEMPPQQTVLQQTVLQQHQSSSYSINSAQPGQSDDDVLDLLSHHGISPRATKTLAKQYPAERIREKVEIFDYLQRINSSLVAKNPPGWLRLAIEENYYPPADYLQAKASEERRRQAEEEQARTAAEELRRRAEELSIPPQERAARSLRAWERARERMGKPALTATERTEWIRNQVVQFTRERGDFFTEHPELMPGQQLPLAGDGVVSPAVVTNPLPPGSTTIPSDGPAATQDHPQTLILARDASIGLGSGRRFRGRLHCQHPP